MDQTSPQRKDFEKDFKFYMNIFEIRFHKLHGTSLPKSSSRSFLRLGRATEVAQEP
jgi:hypothetical protein